MPRSLDFLGEAIREMHSLCREVNETIQICGRDGDYMIVLAMAEPAGHFRVTSRIGIRVSLELDGLRRVACRSSS